MNKKGISVVSLSVTIVILIVIVSTISVSITYSTANAKKLTFAKEIYNIQSIVTEYIQKENVLPAATEAIQIQPSDLEQFAGEKITDGKLILNVLDLTEIDIVNTNYGNKKIGDTAEDKTKDIYAVSAETGRVYYIAGFKDKSKTYYTLTDELINMIEKKQQLLISEKTIIFTPSKLGWSNEAISVKVTVPDTYEVTSFGIDNKNIKYTEETVDNTKVYTVNSDKTLENYEITVNYTKDGTQGNVKYKTKLDLTAPSIFKDQNVTNTSKTVKGLTAKDEESGIKHFKYAEGIINDTNVKEYMKSHGKKVNNGTIKMKVKSVYTLYSEDKAGNYSILHVDGDGERFYPIAVTATGSNEIMVNKSYNLKLINCRIYGNSMQDDTPSLDTPVEVQSVGDRTVNLFDVNNANIIGGDISNNTLNGYSSAVKTFATICIKCEPSTTYTVSREIIGKRFAIATSQYEPNTNITMTNMVEGYDSSSLTISSGENDKYLYVWFYNSSYDTEYTYQEMMNKIQIQEGTVATEYETYGKYKIPVTVSGKNLLNCDYKSYTTVSGITVTYNDDGSIRYKGTATSALSLYLTRTSFTLPAGTYTINNISNTCRTYLLPGYISGTFTIDKETTFTGVYVNVPNGATLDNVLYPQLEKGSTATEYQPYVKPTTTNIYLDEPLRKIGNYADYIDFESGKIVRNIFEKTFNGDENIDSYVNGLYIAILHTQEKGLSSHFEYLAYQLAGSNKFSTNINGGGIHFFVTDTVEEFKAWLKKEYKGGTPVKIYYVLAKSTEEKINIPEINLNYGTNIISIDTNIAPSETNITYYKKQ